MQISANIKSNTQPIQIELAGGTQGVCFAGKRPTHLAGGAGAIEQAR
jgi:hypothetical protein